MTRSVEEPDESRPLEDSLLRLQSSLLSSITTLRLSELTVLEVEILARLIGCRRTTAELVEEIYGTPSATEGYAADYYRVRRATRSLERRGFISSPLFGRKKPYHLTKYAVSVLTSIGSSQKPERIVSTTDAAAYLCTLVLTLLTVLYAKSALSWGVILPGLMLVSLGLSLGRLGSMVRKVM